MKDLIEKHLEAYKDILLQVHKSNMSIPTAAQQCAEISKNYGEIKKLEGMTEVVKIFNNDIVDGKWDSLKAKKLIKELEKDLENLKNPKPDEKK